MLTVGKLNSSSWHIKGRLTGLLCSEALLLAGPSLPQYHKKSQLKPNSLSWDL